MGDIDLAPPAHHIPEGAATIGKDGNAYLLSSDKVYVISASGQIQKKIPLAKPDGGFSAMGLQYSEGLLVVSFAKQGKPEALFQYAVLNASTGAPLGLYAPTGETGNTNVCFSRREGFLFCYGQGQPAEPDYRSHPLTATLPGIDADHRELGIRKPLIPPAALLYQTRAWLRQGNTEILRRKPRRQ